MIFSNLFSMVYSRKRRKQRRFPAETRHSDWLRSGTDLYHRLRHICHLQAQVMLLPNNVVMAYSNSPIAYHNVFKGSLYVRR